MKRSYLLAALCLLGVNASAHDIEVPNADGVTIYYNYINNHSELAVTCRGADPHDYYNEYNDIVAIPEEVAINGKTLRVTIIEDGAFCDCPTLTSVGIPNSVTSIGDEVFRGNFNMTSVSIGNSVTRIGAFAFLSCNGLHSIIIPNSVTTIGSQAFYACHGLTSVTIGNNMVKIGSIAFGSCTNLKDMYCYAEQVPEISNDIFNYSNYTNATLHVPAASVDAYSNAEQWKDFGNIVALPAQDDYRPFIVDNKVWKVGNISMGNPVQLVEYYYFDGDTIIDGKTCKQMMCQRIANPEHPSYAIISQNPLSCVGVWYEENKKVYTYNETNKQFQIIYDFSHDTNVTLQINNQSYVIGPKQTGGIEGFKGEYRDVMMLTDAGNTIQSTPWLEGIGGIYGPTINVFDGELADPAWFLMACYVGDEVIYFNNEYEDAATPEAMNARRRFDFTHTVKTQPKIPRRREAELSLSGEYDNLQLGINLDQLDDTYLVCISDETGKEVYEKTIDAGNIVALNIDISAYTEGRYTIIVENSYESFIGEFEARTTGIEEVRKEKEVPSNHIYNLKGQRIEQPRKGVNIVRMNDGTVRKVVIK